MHLGEFLRLHLREVGHAGADGDPLHLGGERNVGFKAVAGLDRLTRCAGRKIRAKHGVVSWRKINDRSG